MDPYSALTREQLIELLLAQTEQIRALREQVATLEQQLNPPPGGSGPAARTLPDWVKANKPAKPKTQRKKRAFAAVRPRAARADRVEDHKPECCPDCGRKLSGGTLHHTREVVDLPPVRSETVSHRFFSRYCGVCKKRVLAKADLSEQVVGKCRIGINLTSLVAYLHTVARMPVRTIQQTLLLLYGVRLSVGQICGLLERVARVGAPRVQELLDRVRSSPVVHADETGWREGGQNGYVWSFTTKDTRYYIRYASRANQIPRQTLGEEFDGCLVTDFYGGYSYYLGEHQRCWVHLLRDLHELKARHPNARSVERFADRLKLLFNTARSYENEDAYKRRKARLQFERQALAITRPFLKQDLPQRTLAERVERHIKELFTFVEQEEVPPDNNAAERAIRPMVIKRKVCGGTRSPAGSITVCALMSLAATWQLRGQNVIECFRKLLAEPPQHATTSA